MSLYGYTTKKDLTGLGTIAFFGLIGIVIAGIINIFLQSSGLNIVTSIIGVVVFIVFIAYDTQKIKDTQSANMDRDSVSRLAIIGALKLYLDFVNLFIELLQLFGDRKN